MGLTAQPASSRPEFLNFQTDIQIRYVTQIYRWSDIAEH